MAIYPIITRLKSRKVEYGRVYEATGFFHFIEEDGQK